MMLRLLALSAACALAHRPLGFLWRKEPYLLEFSSKNAQEDSRKMKPIVKQLEKKLKTRFVRLDIWNDPGAYQVFMLLDKAPNGKTICGGLPFYYNRKTGEIVCGATTYENLENWATGQTHLVGQPPRMSMEEIEIKGRVTGKQARLARAVARENQQRQVSAPSNTAPEEPRSPLSRMPN
ncbi:hypothetical protein CTAYLR_004223 [Chrysophaeum taylorii]|uniref:Uncharacterized protein n=1 Tax=Chrysophaeum taylorii TaxID=2483200 RepID=A0AAD7UCE9_9STRA|nr:hypothetical protein CTAYLR_004223 [Chrysophaeum taylorii]